jgi:hypothetical protein
MKCIQLFLCRFSFLLVFWLSLKSSGVAQLKQPPTVNSARIGVAAGASAALWIGSYVALNRAWYAKYPKSKFHFFNDNNEWEQMDKMGHAWTAYQVARFSTQLWKWTGLKNQTSALIGGASALAYQSIIEIHDGFSAEWGFSWGDMLANTTGASLFVLQELYWNSQRLQLKFNYWPLKYAPEFQQRSDDLFGTNPFERALKDYNSQGYWLAANPNSFGLKSAPSWINVAFGYSSDLMLGATENKWTGKDGSSFDYKFIHRVRRFYIAPDIDFSRINTKSSFLTGTFFVLNMLKSFIAPTIEYNTRKKIKVHLFAWKNV